MAEHPYIDSEKYIIKINYLLVASDGSETKLFLEHISTRKGSPTAAPFPAATGAPLSSGGEDGSEGVLSKIAASEREEGKGKVVNGRGK